MERTRKTCYFSRQGSLISQNPPALAVGSMSIACTILGYGEMSEWFKDLVLKTSDAVRHRGFESYSLRHNMLV